MPTPTYNQTRLITPFRRLGAVSLRDIPPGHPIQFFARTYKRLIDDTLKVPFKASLRPAEISGASIWMTILELRSDADGHDFLIRYQGAELVDMVDGDFTGRMASEAMGPAIFKNVLPDYMRALEAREVRLSESHPSRPNREYVRMFRGSFPVADASGEVRYLYNITGPVDAAIYPAG